LIVSQGGLREKLAQSASLLECQSLRLSLAGTACPGLGHFTEIDYNELDEKIERDVTGRLPPTVEASEPASIEVERSLPAQTETACCGRPFAGARQETVIARPRRLGAEAISTYESGGCFTHFARSQRQALGCHVAPAPSLSSQ
jgi:hypothetical protein